MTRTSASPAARLRPRLLRWSALALLAAAPALRAQTPATLPDTPAGRRATALLQLIQDPSEERVRAFTAEHTTDDSTQVPMAQRAGMLRQLGALVGGAPVSRVRSTSPTALDVSLAGAQGTYTIELQVQEAPPHRISGWRVRLERDDPGPAPTAPLTAADRAALVDTTLALVRRFYVSPDTAEIIAAHLRERARAGAYDGITDRAAFAQALSADLQHVNGDPHLRAVAGRAPAQPRRRTASAPATASDPAGGYLFVDEVRVLPGNVGYLKYSGFSNGPEAEEETVRALRALQGTDAVVIDLRGHRGGSASLAQLLVSHFTAPGLRTLTRYNHLRDDTTQIRTLDEVPGPRRTDVPLFVLTDSTSRSAAEHVAFVLQRLGRATIVGERTAGAGRNNQYFPLGQGMDVSVSVSRVWDPCTRAEWERVGVQPDLAVPAAEALEAALRAARDPARRPAARVPQAECRLAGG